MNLALFSRLKIKAKSPKLLFRNSNSLTNKVLQFKNNCNTLYLKKIIVIIKKAFGLIEQSIKLRLTLFKQAFN